VERIRREEFLRYLAQLEKGSLGEFQNLNRLLSRPGWEVVEKFIKSETVLKVAD
jgi:hypothetical protein